MSLDENLVASYWETVVTPALDANRASPLTHVHFHHLVSAPLLRAREGLRSLSLAIQEGQNLCCGHRQILSAQAREEHSAAESVGFLLHDVYLASLSLLQRRLDRSWPCRRPNRQYEAVEYEAEHAVLDALERGAQSQKPSPDHLPLRQGQTPAPLIAQVEWPVLEVYLSQERPLPTAPVLIQTLDLIRIELALEDCFDCESLPSRQIECPRQTSRRQNVRLYLCRLPNSVYASVLFTVGMRDGVGTANGTPVF